LQEAASFASDARTQRRRDGRGDLAAECGWERLADLNPQAAGQVLGFALQKLRGSLRLIPSTHPVFSKGFL